MFILGKNIEKREGEIYKERVPFAGRSGSQGKLGTLEFAYNRSLRAICKKASSIRDFFDAANNFYVSPLFISLSFVAEKSEQLHTKAPIFFIRLKNQPCIQISLQFSNINLLFQACMLTL